uniref:G_PROTEIN_RECEP_F1_2 domain-containing protein n=1 Tax=Panagrellus redivivus TaxID=6233 RepID=A0A7E4V1B5_PANRE
MSDINIAGLHAIGNLTNHEVFEDVNDSIIEEEQLTRKHIKFLFCIIYAILFVLGTIGNGVVIVMICNVMLSINRNYGSVRQRVSASATKHVFIYVLGLSIVDLMVILHLPFLVFEMVEGQWKFGTLMCKLYWYGESVNKLLSSFLMTVLSWDRYLAVCSPITSLRVRQNSVAIGVLLSCSFIATLLLSPVLKESTVLKVNKLTGERLSDADIEMYGPDIHEIVISKCIFDTTTPVFMCYTFIVGYLVPAMLISYFYFRVIRTLQLNTANVIKHCHSQAPAQDRLQKVTQRIVAVVLFYFFCWTPYWLLNIFSQFNLIIVSWSTLTLSSVFFGAHILVCFNSAANPVLYALINRELRQQHMKALNKRRQSFHMTAHHNINDSHAQNNIGNKNRLSVVDELNGTNKSPLAMKGKHSLADIRKSQPPVSRQRYIL